MSLSQLQQLLPLPEEDLHQILEHGATLTKEEAAEHFKGILGEAPAAVDFISTFNSKRKEPEPPRTDGSMSPIQGVPKPARAPKKKKAPLHALPARQVAATEYESQGRAYRKDQDEEYLSAKKPNSAASSGFSLSTKPDAVQAPVVSSIRSPNRLPPSATGSLISDIKTKSRPTSSNNSRNSSPAPSKSSKTKVTITGGTAMHGASTALSALDSAIRSLELSTNPSKQDNASRACNCIATRHALLAAAPNCLNCGKVICVKEGLGPCTFCGHALLSSEQIQGMIRSLKEERGREKMSLDAQSHRRAEVSKVPAPFSNPRAGGPTPGEHGMSAAEIKAKEHRDKLLGFQQQNAKRTTVHDEAADFETPQVGTNMWGSVEERARQLKRQQRILAEQEWNARPEYEKRREVLSVDIVGGKVIRKYGSAKMEMPKVEDEPVEDQAPLVETSGNSGKGTFSRNPLLGSMIKPVWNPGKGKEVVEADAAPRKKAWRRVQDDYDDESAEQMLLDGGALGGQDTSQLRPGEEEHAFG